MNWFIKKGKSSITDGYEENCKVRNVDGEEVTIVRTQMNAFDHGKLTHQQKLLFVTDQLTNGKWKVVTEGRY